MNARRNPASPNTFLFLPVNELALGWQRKWVDVATPIVAGDYIQRYDDLITLLAETFDDFPDAISEGEVIPVVAKVESEGKAFALGKSELALAIRDVKDDLGSLEEYEATLLGGEKPNWGILGGSLPAKGFSLVTPFGQKFARPIHKTTLQLERDILLSNVQVKGAEAKFPVIEMGKSPEGYRTYFMCASEVTSDTGYNLAPSLGSVRAKQSAAGMIKALLEGDVWDVRKFWEDSTVMFALPAGGDRVSRWSSA